MEELDASQVISEPKVDDVYEAARALGEVIAQTPQYIAFLDTLQVVNHDALVQKIGSQIRSLRNQAQWGQQTAQQSQELETLERQLEALEVVRTYRKAEAALREMMVAVDQSLSQIIGVAFAANAKRSCCG
ncbi:MAG: YlbF family regulator [Anaerolineales bacterium]